MSDFAVVDAPPHPCYSGGMSANQSKGSADEQQERIILVLVAVGLLALAGMWFRRQQVRAPSELRAASTVRTAPRTPPPRLHVDFTPQRLTLTGSVSSQAARAKIHERAAAAFPHAAVDDELTVVTTPEVAPWLLPAVDVLDAAKAVRWGSLECSGALVRLAGEVPTSEAQADLAKRLASMHVEHVTIAAPDVKVVQGPAVEADRLKADLVARMGTRRIELDDDGKLSAESRKLLDEVAPLLRDLRGLKVEVVGHTDGGGALAPRDLGDAGDDASASDAGGSDAAVPDAGNASASVDAGSERPGAAAVARTLAQARAVVLYLGSKGVDVTHLEAKGMGDAKPRRSNATPEGRQENRRVELEPVELH